MASAAFSHEAAFSDAALRYLTSHAIDPDVAARAGVIERNGSLHFPYCASDGTQYERSRRLFPGSHPVQPPGEPLTLWWPMGRPRPGSDVIVCEGESDALAALTALYGPGGDARIGIGAVPGASFPADRLLEELAVCLPRTVFLVGDGDKAGRDLLTRSTSMAQVSPLPVQIVPVQMADGLDLADWLASLREPGAAPLLHLLADCELAYDEQRRAQAAEIPVDRLMSDRANADRLLARYGDQLRYCHDEGSWRIWDGARWRRDSTGDATRCAMAIARSIYDEADALSDSDDRRKLLAHARRSENDSRLRAMLNVARNFEELSANSHGFDADPYLLCVRNGVIDLRTGQLLAHAPNLMQSEILDVEYDPQARSPLWERFVGEICGGHPGYVSYLRRAIGYSLTGSTEEEKLFLLHGPGGTGKSTLLAAVQAVLGAYSKSADISMLVPQAAGRPRNDVARLRTARMVTISESDERTELAAALLKRLTGGDTVVARFLFQEEFEYRPQLKLWLASNHLPVVDARDSGMLRRVRVLPFDVAPQTRSPQLKRDLQDIRLHGSAILAWAVQGCLEWQRQPLDEQEPEPVRHATMQLAAQSDPIGCWLSSGRVVRTSQAFTPSAELWADFQRTVEQLGKARTVTQTEFGRRLAAEGFQRHRTVSARGFAGVALTS